MRSLPGCALSAFIASSAVSACDSEVTLHLLRDQATAADSGAGGDASANAAGEGGLGGSDTAAGAGGAGGDSGDESGPLPELCKPIGSEVCNGGDDDCNTVVDDACELSVRWAPQPDGSALGHVTGGFSITEPCVPGSVLTGLRVGMGKWLNQVGALCRQVELHTDLSDAGPSYSYVLGPWYDLPLAPSSTPDDKNMVRDLSCPDDNVLTGLQGTVSDAASRYVLALRISCAPPAVSGALGAEVLDADRSQEKWTAPIMCVDCAASPVYNYTMAIPSGRVASRLFGAVGVWVDRVGFGTSRAFIVAK